MSLQEEQASILEMVEAGKISAKDAAELLQALGMSYDVVETALPIKKRKPRWLCITIVKDDEKKVNIKVPLMLLKAGVKLKGMLPDSFKAKAKMETEDSNNINFILEDLDAKNVDAFVEALMESAIEVEGGDGEIIRIFCT
jgi:hypothetical protein